MSELFIELFSEEVPAKLQIKAREQLKEILSNFFEQHSVKYNGEIRIFSTPNRIAINAKGLPKEVLFKSKEVKGPSINACLLYTSPSPRDWMVSRMPSAA